jgi:rhodanese-related sulfurtransferase
LLFLCRSGVRSQNAAKAVTAAGFTRCYNVLGGFEGNPDEHGHRGTMEGWKVDGLSWTQD